MTRWWESFLQNFAKHYQKSYRNFAACCGSRMLFSEFSDTAFVVVRSFVLLLIYLLVGMEKHNMNKILRTTNFTV